MKNEINDIQDIISVVVGALCGLFITDTVKSRISIMLLEQRGKEALGGEVILYAAVLGLSTYIIFQIVQIILHKFTEP